MLELIHHADDGLEVCVDDTGVGFSPRPDSPGMGLGMPLIAAMSQHMEIHTDRQGTRVCMTFEPAP